MLPRLLQLLPSEFFHRALVWLGIDEDSFHEWMPGFCPCDCYDNEDGEDTAA